MNRLFCILLVTLTITACAHVAPQASKPEPPVAQRIAHADTLHGVVVQDPYHWLKDKSRTVPGVLSYVEAENAYAEAWMKPLAALEDSLFEEIIGRIAETDLSVPDKEDGWYYYSRRSEGLQYPIFCRRQGSMDAPEQIYLDMNELATGHEYYALGSFSLSPDQTLLAYSYDTTADEIYTLVIKDLITGELLPDIIPGASDVTWAAAAAIFYTTDDESGRSDNLWRHDLGADEDTHLFYEPDGRFYLYTYRTASDEYIVMGAGSKTTSEMWVMPADSPDEPFELVAPREQGVEYYLDHRDDGFFITTNADGASSYKIAWTHEDSLGRENWRGYIPWRETVDVGCTISQDWMAVIERVDGVRRLRLIHLDSGEEHYLSMPEDVYTIGGGYFTEYEDETLRFTYTSLATPHSVYEYNCRTRELSLLKQQEVKDYDASLYHTERVWATASDGVKVSITLFYRPDMLRADGGNPCYLEGYGAYGDPNDPMFFSAMLSLVDRGFVYALAHVRGGGDLGQQWHEDGRMLHKANTFSDYIACAEYLVDSGYTNPDQLVGYGASAGGLLIGAVANMRPDLFAVIIADVPFVDVLNTMLDPTLSATISEYEEWGDPNEERYFQSILGYCPYQNVTAQDYPAMIVLAGFYDPRVNYWEPAKLVARLRYLKTDDNPLLLRTDMSGGHAGASGRYDFYRELAMQYAFIIHTLPNF
ncbi:MAG: S9 family peptidase [Candidatus Cloacimonetes bacterium]|nr:S9 family peptidase [Candidatus Cloacimonadota bacterium]